MNNSIKKNLGIGQIIAAAFFLFNPNISIVDLLPDVFGYLLLFSGLTCLADLNDSIREARKQFGRMVLVSGAELVSLLWIFGMSAMEERSTSFLLFSFVFGILSVLFLLPGYKHLFDGMLYLGSRHNGESVFRKLPVTPKQKQKKYSRSEKIKWFTYVFVFAKPILAVLPEVSALSNVDSYFDFSAVNWYQFLPLFRIFSLLLAFPILISWLVCFLKYWNGIRKDQIFMQELKDRYASEILPKESLFLKRSLYAGLTMLCVAAVFFVDFYLSDLNIFPDFIAAVIGLVLAVRWKKILAVSDKGSSGLGKISLVLLVVSAAEWGTVLVFHSLHTYTDLIMMQESALWLYRVCCGLTVLEAIALILWFWMVVRACLTVVRHYTGYIYNMSDSAAEAKRTEEQKPLRYRLYLCALFAILTALGKICYRMMIPYVKFELVSVVTSIIGILFLVIWFTTVSEIREQIENRYLLE